LGGRRASRAEASCTCFRALRALRPILRSGPTSGGGGGSAVVVDETLNLDHQALGEGIRAIASRSRGGCYGTSSLRLRGAVGGVATGRATTQES